MAPRKPKDGPLMTIQHMRICIGEETCRVTIYHGIDEYSTTTATEGDGKVYGQRPGDKAYIVLGESKCYLEAVVIALQSFLSYRNHLVNSLEWDLDIYDVREFQEILNFLKPCLKGIQLRVKKLVFNHNAPETFMKKIAHQFCDRQYLEAIEKRSVAPSAVSPDPLFVIDNFHRHFWNGITMRFSRIYLENENVTFEEMLQTMALTLTVSLSQYHADYVTLRAPHENPEEMFNSIKAEEHVQDGKYMKTVSIGNISIRHFLSSCGYWVTAFWKRDDRHINWKSDSCGLREFCSKCTCSFERDYFYDLPRRIVEDPDWINVYCLVLNKRERDGYFSKLTKLIEKTPPLRVRRAVEGFKDPTVNLKPWRTRYIICTLIAITLITAILYYFEPSLPSLGLFQTLAILLSLFIVIRMFPEGSSLKTFCSQLYYSFLIAMTCSYLFPRHFNTNLMTLLVFVYKNWS